MEVDTTSLSSGVFLKCQFHSGVTGTASCLVLYGSDPSYQNLPLQNHTSQNLTAGNTITILLSDVLSLNSTRVYYIVVAQTESQAVNVTGFFRIGENINYNLSSYTFLCLLVCTCAKMTQDFL